MMMAISNEVLKMNGEPAESIKKTVSFHKWGNGQRDSAQQMKPEEVPPELRTYKEDSW